MGRRHALALVISLSGAIVAPQSASGQTARDSVVATVQEFFRAMKANDVTASRRVMLPDGQYYATRQDSDSLVVRRMSHEAHFQRLAASRDTIVERIWNPTVLVHGAIATLWAPYDLYRNGQLSHCGVDAFTLIRTGRGWAIASIVYTVEPKDCVPSPLGPPPKTS